MTMRVYGGSEDNCDGGGDAEGQKKQKRNCSRWRQTHKHKIKKEIVSAGVKLAVREFYKYEEKQHWNISLMDPEAIQVGNI